ncbi:MAG: cell division protein FtsL [Oceanicaulis sp.]
MIRIVEILAGGVAMALIAALYLAKTGAEADQQRLAELQAEIGRERARIDHLQAEVALQEDPENLRRLARIYLGFEPLRPEQEWDLADLPRAGRESGEAAPQAVRASLPAEGR